MGSHILRKLIEERYAVVCLKRSFSDCSSLADLSDKIHYVNIDETTLSDIFSMYSIDTVIHCATVYGRDGRNDFSVYESNLIFPIELLKTAEENGCKCFVNTSTFFIKELVGKEWQEKVYLDSYVKSKQLFAQTLQALASTFRMVVINMQPEHIYGPGDRAGKFANFIISSLFNNSPCLELSSGIQTRDWVYVDDVVDAYITVLKHQNDFEQGAYISFEIGTGYETSIREFVELAKSKINCQTILKFGERDMNPGELLYSKGDIHLLKELGWQPLYNLSDGISQMIKEYKSENDINCHTNL